VQDARYPARSTAVAGVVVLRVGLGGDRWQDDGKRRALPRGARDDNVAAALLDDAVDGRQSKTGGWPGAFGRKERLEDLPPDGVARIGWL
jgi:hypothetical protein